MPKKFNELRENLKKDTYVPKIVSDDGKSESGRGDAQRRFVAKHVTDFFKTPVGVGMEHQFTGTVPQADYKGVTESEDLDEKQKEAGDENVQNFIKSELKRMGKSMDDLSDKEKKDLFDKVDRKFKADNESVNESLNEDVLSDLKSIVSKKQAMDVKFKNGKTQKVDTQSASVLLKVYDNLGSSVKKRFEDQLNKGPNSFMKLLDFADSNVG